MNTYFTSDTHLQHANIIKYCNRPFKNVDEMDETIITNWNSIVKHDDLVYHLGDIGFGDIKNVLRRLNGKIVLIRGSHDKSALAVPERFESTSSLLEIKIDRQYITLCHYAMRSWPRSFHGSWHLFGHSHGRLPPLGKSFDVGVDNHNFYPWSLDEIKEKINSLEENGD
jgi:calcineurin-like phosphoesterase family protein